MKTRFLVFLLLLLFLIGCVQEEKVLVSNLVVDKGNPAQFKFDMSHNFPEKRYCYSNVTLFKDELIISQDIEYLGEFEPEEKQGRVVEVEFPGDKTDYQIEISCFKQKI
ncbi:MAG: hypothetical protein MAG795_00493 [Candidatus Woesearchaeota archaeon]|nr:hypothetical protein [Candidatus Woesearchaeota archaeon]